MCGPMQKMYSNRVEKQERTEDFSDASSIPWFPDRNIETTNICNQKSAWIGTKPKLMNPILPCPHMTQGTR
jgi:hypothetical protein